MSAVLNRFGAPVVDAQAVALGYMHLSDDPDVVAEGQRAIAEGYDVPLFSLDVVEDVEEETAAPVESAPEFPGVLEDGESAEHMGDGVWRVTYQEGFTYQLTPARYYPGQYGVGRVLEDGSVRGWSAIFDDTSITPVVKWTRLESQTLAWTHEIQAKYADLHKQYDPVPVPFSLDLVVEELEPGRVWKVSRFGNSGVLVLQGWGYALLGETGDFPETPNRKFKDGKRWRYAIQCIVGGLGDVPTERMRLVAVDHSGEPCAVNGHDAGQSCESGKRNKAFPRFVVEVTGPNGEIVGTVPMCAHCWARRAVGGDTRRVADIAWHLSEGKGSWVDWQDRAEDLTGELIAAALDAGQELPDVPAALYAEALAEGNQRAAKTARAAAAKGGARKAEADAVRDRVLSGRRAVRAELIAWAEERHAAWGEWFDGWKNLKGAERDAFPEFVPPVKPGPSVEVAADDTSYAGEDDDQEQGESTVGRGSMAPKKTTAVKVGDIVFSGEKGSERAELSGHLYSVTMLAGTYTVRVWGTQETVCQYEPKRAAMKRAILADAVARGAAEPVTEEQPEPVAADSLPRPLRLALEREAAEAQSERQTLAFADLEGKQLADFTSPEDLADLERMAGPWPVRWLFAPEKGDPRRVLHLFAGCGGWCVGIRRVLGEQVDMVCVDLNRDAVATSIAAGCTAIQADVTTLYPEAYALRYTSGLVMSPPCIDWTMSGKRAGLTGENIGILLEAISEAAYVAGNYELDSTEYGGQCEEHDEDEGEACTGAGCCADSCCWSEHMGRSIGSPETWTSVRETAARMSGKTARLMVEPVIWALGLKGAGAPLETIVMEQSDQLPQEIREEIESEFMVAGSWGTVGMAQQCDWVELDAADFGSPSHRRRAFLVAGWGRAAYTAGLPQAPEGLSTTAAEALPTRPTGLEILTRGNRRTSGGNAIRLARTIPCVTSKIRSWDVEFHGGRFTLGEVAALVTLPPEYAELAEGSRSSVCQQFADIVAPVISAAVFGAACGRSWLPELMAYLAKLYPGVHGQGDDADTAEIPVQPSAGESVEVSGLADTDEIPVKPQPTPGLYAPVLHAEERQGEEADACRAAGHRYMWLVVEAEGVSRTLRSYLTCTCTGEKLGNFGRSGPSMNQGTQTKPLGIRDASIASALGVAKRNSYTTKGPWEIVSDTLKRCPVEWDHAKPLPAAVDPAREKKKPGEPGFMTQLLEEHEGPAWRPGCTFNDPEFTEEEEEPTAPAQGLSPLTRQQRSAAWRLAAGEAAPAHKVTVLGTGGGIIVTPADTFVPVGELEPAPVRAELTVGQRAPIATPYVPPARVFVMAPPPKPQPDHGRKYWEMGVRVTLNHRAGRTSTSRIGKGVQVIWDDAEAWQGSWVVPEELWLEGTEPRDWFAPVVAPVAVVEEDGPDYAAISRANRAAAEPEPEPVDPRIAWAAYEQPEPVVDVLAELRAELEELRLDVEEWGAEVAALAVAEAERIVVEVAADMRAAELLALRDEAAAVRESLGWGPIVWEPVPQRSRGGWGLAATVAGAVAGVGAALGQVMPPRV
ncbi:DNA cytosine methyltransferase [Streptomyces erythrochromogenes]|uniref:DNA cytosine methyltransferase n=1 Tax=Streptomyces erythrochromogenes TaxID=285574 RepID=UPI0036FCDA1E